MHTVTLVTIYCSVYSFTCPHGMQNFKGLSPRSHFKVSECNPFSFEARECVFFYSNQDNLFYKLLHQYFEFRLNFLCMLFGQYCAKRTTFWIFEHYEKVKTNFKIFVLAFVEGVMLIWIKIGLSSFKTLKRW